MASPKLLGVLLICFALSFGFSDAITPRSLRHYVNGRQGWVLHPIQDYNQWAGSNRFLVHDTLLFRYNKETDSVLEVSKEDYDSCNTDHPIQKKQDGESEFQLDHSGPFYFISGNKTHCEQGQKIIVKVLSYPTTFPTPPASSPAGAHSQPPPSAQTPGVSLGPTHAPPLKPPGSPSTQPPAAPAPGGGHGGGGGGEHGGGGGGGHGGGGGGGHGGGGGGHKSQPPTAASSPKSAPGHSGSPPGATSGPATSPSSGTPATSGPATSPSSGTPASSGPASSPSSGTPASSGPASSPSSGTPASSGPASSPSSGTPASSGPASSPSSGIPASSGPATSPSSATPPSAGTPATSPSSATSGPAASPAGGVTSPPSPAESGGPGSALTPGGTPADVTAPAPAETRNNGAGVRSGLSVGMAVLSLVVAFAMWV